VTEPKRYPLIQLLIIVMLVVAAIEVAWGQENCRGHSCNSDGAPIDVSQSVAGPVIGGSDSLGLGFGGPQFDVDIAQCMGTQSDSYLWNIWSKQRMTENYWCHAITLINAGYVEAGTYMLCNHTVLGEMNDCPGPLFVTAEPEDNHKDEVASIKAELYSDFNDFKAEQMQEIAMQHEEPPTVHRIVQKTPFLSDSKRAALAELKEQ